MNHKEICAIVRVCVKSNVKELCLGELKVSFFDPNGTQKVAIMPQVAQDPESLSKMKELDQKTLEALELEAKQDQLDEMLIQDPMQYEELVLAGDIEDRDAQSQARGSKQALS